jgi:hypothetical protein
VVALRIKLCILVAIWCRCIGAAARCCRRRREQQPSVEAVDGDALIAEARQQVLTRLELGSKAALVFEEAAPLPDQAQGAAHRLGPLRSGRLPIDARKDRSPAALLGGAASARRHADGRHGRAVAARQQQQQCQVRKRSWHLIVQQVQQRSVRGAA